jgi:hypothetical protein
MRHCGDGYEGGDLPVSSAPGTWITAWLSRFSVGDTITGWSLFHPPLSFRGSTGRQSPPKSQEKRFGKRWIVEHGTGGDKVDNLSKSYGANNN